MSKRAEVERRGGGSGMAYTSVERLEEVARARFVDGLSWAKAAARAGLTESAIFRMRRRGDADWLEAVRRVCGDGDGDANSEATETETTEAA